MKKDLSHSTSQPVTVTVHYAGGYQTRITVPFQMAITGAATGRHPDLSDRDKPNQHPSSCVTPAVDVSSDSAGWVNLGSQRNDHVTFTSAGAIVQGIATKWADTDETPVPDRMVIMLYIPDITPANPYQVIDGASVPSGLPNTYNLALAAVAGAPMPLGFDSPTVLWFWLNRAEERWCLDRYQSYTVPAIGGGGSGGSFAGAITGGDSGDTTTTIDGGHA